MIVLVAAIAAFCLVTGTASAQVIKYSCSPGAADCSGWHASDVVLSWYPSPAVMDSDNCPIAKLLTQEGVTNWLCGVLVGGQWSWYTATVRIDKSAPQATVATPSRPPDANGWYHAPVGFIFGGTDAVSGIGACTTATYARPDSRKASVTGTCTDLAGNRSAALDFPLRYDATGPRVTRGRPARKPDYRRWYNHPVTWRFRGRDRLSGLADCPPVLFRGPVGRAAHVIGACRDVAGNVTTRAFALRYDATPPSPPSVRATGIDRAVHLGIHVRGSVRRIAVVRAPGIGGARDSTIYHGAPRSLTDHHARNGKHYRYVVVARDRADNRSRTTVHAVAGARLLAPPQGAVVTAPPLLRWTRVRDASYYNVQLRRDGHKVLTAWPAAPRLRLHTQWRFGGAAQQFGPGTYTWDVWPGFGARSDARYGRRLGHRTFVMPGALPAQ